MIKKTILIPLVASWVLAGCNGNMAKQDMSDDMMHDSNKDSMMMESKEDMMMGSKKEPMMDDKMMKDSM